MWLQIPKQLVSRFAELPHGQLLFKRGKASLSFLSNNNTKTDTL